MSNPILILFYKIYATIYVKVFMDTETKKRMMEHKRWMKYLME